MPSSICNFSFKLSKPLASKYMCFRDGSFDFAGGGVEWGRVERMTSVQFFSQFLLPTPPSPSPRKQVVGPLEIKVTILVYAI